MLLDYFEVVLVKEKGKKIMMSFVLCFILSALAVFGQDAQGQGNEQEQQEQQELCDGLQELEARAFQLEQAILSEGEEVPVPEISSDVSSPMGEGEIASCDEVTQLVEQRIVQLEAYMKENSIEISDAEEIDMEAFEKQKKEFNDKSANNDPSENDQAGNDQAGNEVSASQSQGMPSCEQNTMLLRQRIADLEKYIEDNGLEIPEPSEDETAAIEKSSDKESTSEESEDDADDGSDSDDIATDEQEASEQKQEEPKQGFIKGMFKKFTGFFGGNKDAGEIIEQPAPTEVKG